MVNSQTSFHPGVNENGYGPPSGFCFDTYCADEPIMDDNSLEEFNVKDKVNFFVDAARRQVIHCKFNAIYHIVVLPFALHQNAPILICVRFSNLLSELLAQLIACLLTAAVG